MQCENNRLIYALLCGFPLTHRGDADIIDKVIETYCAIDSECASVNPKGAHRGVKDIRDRFFCTLASSRRVFLYTVDYWTECEVENHV